MDPVSQYGFINAKLRAKLGLMKESHVIDELLKTNSLVEAVAVLRDTKYSEVASVFDSTGDLQQMEVVFLHGEIAMYHEVARYLDGKPSDFVHLLLGKIEVDNLKNAIRLWYSSLIRHRPMRYRSEYLYKQKIVWPIDWPALVNATTWDNVVKALSSSPYHDVVKKYTQESIEELGLFSLESELDLQYYAQIMEGLKSLSSDDRQVAQRIFLVDLDLKNLLIMVRFGWFYHLKADQLYPLLLPWGKVYKSKEVQTFIATQPEARDPFVIIDRFYPGLGEKVHHVVEQKRGSVKSDELTVLQNLAMESYLHERRKDVFHSILGSDPFTIGLPLSYFFLVKEENSMIKAILNGKYYGYTEEYIRGVFA